MKTKCYSVRLKSLTDISPKCWKAEDFQGHEDLIPDSQYFGRDYDVQKSDAYWVSEWILEKKNIQYSHKKEAWFDSVTRKMIPSYVVEKHTPLKISPKESNSIKDLKR